jgi:hypothetical protein
MALKLPATWRRLSYLTLFFQSVFTKEDPGPLPPPPSVPDEHTLENFPIEEEDVRKVLASLQALTALAHSFWQKQPTPSPNPSAFCSDCLLRLGKYQMTGDKQWFHQSLRKEADLTPATIGR